LRYLTRVYAVLIWKEIQKLKPVPAAQAPSEEL
jgi:hypothetical protein